MLWNKTKCALCHANASCSEKTKFFINYCGSQREKNQTLYSKALEECRTKQGLNYMNFHVNQKHKLAKAEEPDPIEALA